MGGNWGEKGRFLFFPPHQLFAYLLLLDLPHYLRAWNRLYLKGSDTVFILYRLTPEDIKEGVTIPLKFVMFQNVASLMVSKVKS